MLNNTANSSPNNLSKPSLMVRLKGKKRKLLLLLIAVLVAGFLAYLTTNGQLNVTNPFVNEPEDTPIESIINSETGELTEEFYENIADVTLDQVREASVSTGINALEDSAISDSERQEEINNEIGNEDPQNLTVSYGVDGVSEPYLEIRQGDLVTWVNDTTEPMVVAGEGWESKTPRDPGDYFTYGFLFVGEYKYVINGNVEGTVSVVRPE